MPTDPDPSGPWGYRRRAFGEAVLANVASAAVLAVVPVGLRWAASIGVGQWVAWAIVAIAVVAGFYLGASITVYGSALLDRVFGRGRDASNPSWLALLAAMATGLLVLTACLVAGVFLGGALGPGDFP